MTTGDYRGHCQVRLLSASNRPSAFYLKVVTLVLSRCISRTALTVKISTYVTQCQSGLELHRHSLELSLQSRREVCWGRTQCLAERQGRHHTGYALRQVRSPSHANAHLCHTMLLTGDTEEHAKYV